MENRTGANAIAKDIGAFVTSATTKGGYYFGRYEAGDGDTTSARTNSTSDTNTMVCKEGQYVYNYISQQQASSLSQSMYTSNNFTSDLINSYAWDTAIIFIQTFGGCADYYRQNFSTSFAKTGVNTDKYCNIHDMSGNAAEWTTETNHEEADDELIYTRCARGGHYDGRRII